MTLSLSLAHQNQLCTDEERSEGAEILYSASFMLPERMERIIHLQLTDNQNRIMACAVCGQSHIEWFKMSQDEAVQTIRNWETLCEESVLYTPDRTLSVFWRQRIEHSTSVVTARDLLAVLEGETLGSEDESERPARLVASPDDVLASQMEIMALKDST